MITSVDDHLPSKWRQRNGADHECPWFDAVRLLPRIGHDAARGPADRLHPCGEAPLACGEPGPPIRAVDVEDRHQIQPARTEVVDVVRTADEDLLFPGEPRGHAVPDPAHGDRRRSCRPPLDVFLAAAPHPEGRGPAGATAARGGGRGVS